MAMSVDGYVAARDGSTPWSNAEWQEYLNVVNNYKNIIIGRKTYEIMLDNNEFKLFDNVSVIVVSRSIDNISGFIFVKTPEDALEYVNDHGFDCALIGGGTMLNSHLLKQGFVDEIHIDLEPVILGSGTKLFTEDLKENNMELIKSIKYGENSIQLQYKIKNNLQ